MDEMEWMSCGKCGIKFCVPLQWKRERQQDCSTWYCPNGHPRVYRESEADKLRREVNRLRQSSAQRDEEVRQLRGQLTMATAREAKERKARKRIETRVQAGVCPDCNRTFGDLARHMATKHARHCEAVAGHA